MSDESAKQNKPEDNEHKSREWLKDYLKGVYGVSMSGAKSIKRELLESGQHAASNLVVDEFTFRLLARFNDLDIAPCDGFISMAEITYAINTPRHYFDDDDLRLFQVLKLYYQKIREVSASENDNEMSHHGLSRHDLEILATSTSKECTALRNRLKGEFVAKERA